MSVTVVNVGVTSCGFFFFRMSGNNLPNVKEEVYQEECTFQSFIVIFNIFHRSFKHNYKQQGSLALNKVQ